MLFGCDVTVDAGDYIVSPDDLDDVASLIAEDLGGGTDPYDVQDDIREILRVYGVEVGTGRRRRGGWMTLRDSSLFAEDRPMGQFSRVRVCRSTLEIDC